MLFWDTALQRPVQQKEAEATRRQRVVDGLTQRAREAQAEMTEKVQTRRGGGADRWGTGAGGKAHGGKVAA